jgi:hypothetical protein
MEEKMNEQDILNLIKNDKWMMDILREAETLNLPDWIIGAGFIRNKVWDYLHGYSKPKVDTADIDLIYYDPNGNNEEADQKLSQKLKNNTGINWEIVNQCYAHVWNNLPPYESAEDAISTWPETATSIGVKIEDGELKLIAPCGIYDLVNLILRSNPKFPDGIEKVKERAKEKQWLEKWPKPRFV